MLGAGVGSDGSVGGARFKVASYVNSSQRQHILVAEHRSFGPVAYPTEDPLEERQRGTYDHEEKASKSTLTELCRDKCVGGCQ